MSEELSPAAIVDAMKAGRFYATTGVTVEEIAWDDELMRVAVRAEEGVEYRVQFLGTLRDFDPTSQPALDAEGKELADATRAYSEDIGQVLLETTPPPIASAVASSTCAPA